MKRFVYAASFEVSPKNPNTLTVYSVDNDLINSIINSDQFSFNNKCKLKFASDVVVDLDLDALDKDISNILYWLKNKLEGASFKKLKQFITDNYTTYTYNLHGSALKNEAKEIYDEVAANIKDLSIPYLTVLVKSESILVYYRPDKDRFDMSSTDLVHNIREINRMVESIPCIVIDNRFREEGSWRLVWNITNTDTSINYIPDISNLAFNTDTVTFKIYWVHPPQYMSRTPFRYTKDNSYMYMVDSSKIVCRSDRFEDFAEAAEYDGTATSWDEFFQELDDTPYEDNGGIITSWNICKIVETKDGHSSTIYTKEMP